MLRAERRRAHPRRATSASREIVNNYARISFNFGPTLLVVARGERARRRTRRSSRPTARAASGSPATARRSRRRTTTSSCRSPTSATGARRSAGASPTSSTASAARRRACGCPRPRSTSTTLEVLARRGHRVHHPRAAPGRARARDRGGRLARRRAAARSTRRGAYRVRLPSGRAIDALLLRRPDLARRRLRRPARQRRAVREPPARRRRGGRRAAATRPRRHRRRDLRPPPPRTATWRSPTRCARSERDGRDAPDQLRRVPGARIRRRDEVEIGENTSWSCAHGVERWRSDCGCTSGAQPGWNQAWRAPLREALDWLRDAVAPPLRGARRRELLRDPWAARDDYVDVVLDRSDRPRRRASSPSTRRARSRSRERVAAAKLLEMQRHALLMYTSCGWFFDDLAGIEAPPGAALRRPRRAARRGALRRTVRGALPRIAFAGRGATVRKRATAARSTIATCGRRASRRRPSAGTTPCGRSSSRTRRRRASSATRSSGRTSGSSRPGR